MRFDDHPRIYIALLYLFLIPGMLNGQTFSFRNYGYELGLPNDFIYTINQSDNGFLWIGTGNGIARFDGYDFYPVIYPDSVNGRNPNTSLKDKNGTLWFGCSDGSVFYARNNILEKLSIENTRSISTIIQGPDSMIYIVPQGKAIYMVNPDMLTEITSLYIPEEHIMFSAAFNNTGLLLLGTQGSILFCERENDSIIINRSIDSFDYSAVSAICPVNNGSKFLIGTEDNGLFILRNDKDSESAERLIDMPEWNYLNVKSVMADNEGRIWVSTFGSGVLEFELSEEDRVMSLHTYNSSTGLASDDSRLVFRDIEGNYWFGLFGKGISMLSSYAFGFFTPGKDSDENNIIYIGNYKNKYLLGTPSGYHIFDAVSLKSESFVNLSRITGGENILSYFLEDNGKLWIGTDGRGLYLRNPDGTVKLFYRSGDSGFDRINQIRMDNSYIWLAATNGVMVLDKRTGREQGTFNSSNGLPGKSINSIFLDEENAYIGTESDRVFIIDRDLKIQPGGCRMTGSTLNRIVALTRDNKGIIWAATYGNGIFACINDSIVSLNRSNGLFSNYCYSIIADSEDNLWAGHANGLSKFNYKTGIFHTYGADFMQGGTCNYNAVFESTDKKVFIGTTRGLIIYDSGKEQSVKIPPLNNITSIVINDVGYDVKPVISLKYGKYRIRIRYSGVNFSNPEMVYYQTFLENYEPEPADLTLDREVTYILEDGKYRFSLLSVGENGLSQEPSISFSLIIAKPFYKKWWFILLSFILITSSVILIIRQREKVQLRIRNYLEDELHKRTELIIKQKNEIEIQNLEITDSINYAKRIQSSILPDVNKLKENFSQAFVIFHPRDIVSGDFYWFDKIDDEKFIIVCADSTGHGVPGAFMSMIGSTLLQDIVTRKKISRPSQVLTLLDKQIFSTLNQNVDLGVANDGMDMVVCEFNLKTRYVRFASAMRPIIIVVSGESFYIKGNRSSVGGESVIEKYFDDQEYYLNKGDAIYLFSDGFPDQFGGADGKKMKIARLKRVIEQNSKLPMHIQEREILRFFNEWKGSHDQVDDVLMMGVRV